MPYHDHDADGSACEGCLLSVDRRRFLRDAALAAGALAALGAAPRSLLAGTVRFVEPTNAAGAERAYPIPASDDVSVDASNEVILVRWQDRAYAFALACPHRGARLRWRPNEGRVYCPKHKARFTPDGSHASGRQTRDLDRHDIRREGDRLVVDLATVRRKDREPEAWSAAVIRLA